MSLLFFFQSILSFGQEYRVKTIGRPFIDIQGEVGINYSVQNFAIAVGGDNKIYLAGAAGMAIYDGANYHDFSLPNQSVLRCVKLAEDGTIYIGGNNDFGYLTTGDNGALSVHSLKEKLGDSLASSFVCSQIFVVGGEIIFQTSQALIVINHKTKEVRAVSIPSDCKVVGMYDDSIYVRSATGLLVLRGDLWVAAAQFETKNIANVGYMHLVEPADGKAVLITDKGFFDFSTLQELAIHPKVAQFLSAATVYKISLLKDKIIGICTNQGILIADLDGNPYQLLTKEKGLSSNTVSDAQLDQNDLLWVATGYGVCTIELFSPFTIFDNTAGVESSTSFITLFQGNIYLSTTVGLLVESMSKVQDPFEQVKFENLLEHTAWRTIPVGDDLIILTSAGTYVLSSGIIKPIAGTRNAIYWAGLKFRDSDEVLLGSSNGQLIHLEKRGDNWVVKREFESMFPSIHHMTQGDGQHIWLSERNFGLYRVVYDAANAEIITSKKYNSENGLPSDTRNYVFSYQEDPIFGTKGGIFSYHRAEDTLLQDVRFAEVTNGKSVRKIAEAANGDIYFYTLENTLHRIKKTGDNYERIDFAPNKLSRRFERHIEVLDAENVLMGTVTSMIHIDPTYHKPSKRFQVNFTKVERINSSDSILYGGFGGIPQKIEVGYSDNSLRIGFSAAFYEEIAQNTYQWRLEGFDDRWSNWSNETQKDYTNIPYGKYSFQVRAKNVYGAESEVATFPLVVLTPWYYTLWAYFAYLIVFLILMRAVLKMNSSRLEEDKRKLEELVRERTQIISEQKDQAERDAGTISAQRDKLLQMDELKSRFFLNISHELRTPLTLTMGTVDQTIKGKFGKLNDQQYANLKVSYRNSERLLKMVNNILDISKLEGGKMQLSASLVKPGDVLAKVIAFFSSKFSDKNITFRSNVEADVELYLDKDKFETIFINLLANAFKFTLDGGTISIALNDLNDHVEIIVSDTGIGIPEEDIPFVFDRFYQSAHIKTGEGTGVGLALSKELVELQSGRIAVESTKDSGTTFTLHFPKGNKHLSKDQIIDTHLDTQTQPLEEKYPLDISYRKADQKVISSSEVSAMNRHILIVEDNYEMRKFLDQILSESYQTSLVENGEEGIKFLKENKVDLILTDYLMPVMDGFEMATIIKKDADLALIPMIFLTARAQEKDKIDVLNLGVDDYLFKPFNAEELKVRVANLLHLKENRAAYWIEKSIDPRDVEWKEFPSNLKLRIDQYISDHIKDEIKVSHLAEFTGQSERSLQRKIKANTGLTIVQYIKEFRLRKARNLLENKQLLSVSEVAHATGFNYLHNFTTSFKQRFGKLPSDYLD